MAKPIYIGEHYFPTQKSAKEEIRKRINKYNFGATLSEEDKLFFSELFIHHSEHDEKIGPGIDFITVEKDFHKNRNLYIHRLDGTKIDISWVHCIQPISDETVKLLAFRRAVKEKVIAFRNVSLDLKIKCPVLQTNLTSDNCHVAYPGQSFDSLVKEFLTSKDRELHKIELINPEPSDDDQRGVFKDKVLEKEWCEYHDKKAVMKLYSKKANLARKS